MELYINSTWTERYGNAYIAEAIACSENGNHTTVYAMGVTADEADNKLMGALRKLKLILEAPPVKGEDSKKGGVESWQTRPRQRSKTR